jgi:hypothetical protein
MRAMSMPARLRWFISAIACPMDSTAIGWGRIERSLNVVIPGHREAMGYGAQLRS